MESMVTALSGAKDLLLEKYMLWTGLFFIILSFGVYVYLVPSSVDFFANPPKEKVVEEKAKTEEVEKHELPEQNDQLN
jgi:hypothetical protein